MSVEWQPGDRAFASCARKKKVYVVVLRVLGRARHGLVTCRVSCTEDLMAVPADALYRTKQEAAETCAFAQQEMPSL